MVRRWEAGRVKRGGQNSECCTKNKERRRQDTTTYPIEQQKGMLPALLMHLLHWRRIGIWPTRKGFVSNFCFRPEGDQIEQR